MEEQYISLEKKRKSNLKQVRCKKHETIPKKGIKKAIINIAIIIEHKNIIKKKSHNKTEIEFQKKGKKK